MRTRQWISILNRDILDTKTENINCHNIARIVRGRNCEHSTNNEPQWEVIVGPTLCKKRSLSDSYPSSTIIGFLTR